MAAPVTTVPLAGPINLLVRLGHGSVTVAARDGLAEATVRLIPRDPKSGVLDRISVELQGPTLQITAARPGGLADLIGSWWRDRDSLDAEIEVPTGTALKISTAGARIAVTGCCGGADLATGAATISLDTVDGDLRLRYGSADATVTAVTGSVQLRAGAGSARFGEVRGGLRARAGSGSASVGATYGDVDIAYGSGSISIGLPVGVSARFDASSGSGRVHSDLPVEPLPTAGARVITVRAHTGSGDVRLLRAAVAPDPVTA